MRIFKTLAHVAAVVALACALNALAMFVLEPCASENRMTWNDYRAQDHIDMVFLGTSIPDRAFDPHTVDAVMGTESFNLCSPAQYLEESLLGLKKVLAEHHPKTVVYGLEFDSITGDSFPDPGRAFIRYKNEGDLGAALSDTLWCLSNERCYTTANSINWLFPWVNEHIFLLPVDIKSNVKVKLGGEPDPGASWAKWQPLGKGFSNDDNRLDYNEGYTFVYSETLKLEPFSDVKLQTLAEMCALCQENGTEFVVAMPPIPVFNIFDYGDAYFERQQIARDFVEAHGGTFYDFNMAKPELFDLKRTDLYADSQHCNRTGAQVFSDAFARVMLRHEKGEETASLFYTKEEYEREMNYVDLLSVEMKQIEGGARIKGHAVAGPQAQLEYQVCVWNDTRGDWNELRSWSEDFSYDFVPEHEGEYRVRMNVREKGSEVPYSRYGVVTVTV